MAKKRKKQRDPKRTQPRQNPTWLRNGVIVGLVVIVLAGALYVTRSDILSFGTQSASAAVQDSEPTIGPTTAPVTIVEYGDFGCPACKSWHQAGIKDQVIAQYGDQVRFVWRDFPVITPMSPKAAEAAECAHDQGRFWAYHDMILERAPRIQVDDLKTYAAELSLDIDQFDQCLDSDQHRATVGQDHNAARALNLRGTPSFVVNGEVLPAPPSFNFLQQVIESKLNSR
jgi:protein-disulfide isomerase